MVDLKKEKEKVRSIVSVIRMFAIVSLFLTGCGVTQEKSETVKETCSKVETAVETTAEPATQSTIEATPESSGLSHTLFAMDTVITMDVYDGQKETATDQSEMLIRHLEDLWSATKEGSEIYELNHSPGKPVTVSEETKNLISFTLGIADETDGALNPAIYPLVQAWGFPTRNYRIPDPDEISELLKYMDCKSIAIEDGIATTVTLPEGMEVDFGAVAKGYTGDLLTETMKEQGVTSAMINLGGNVDLVGNSPDGDPWKVGIRSPYGEGTIGTLLASDCHVITSGGYERYFTGDDGTIYWHILDPKSGYPADSGIISATIVGKEGKLCDALSTAVFVMGLARAEKYWKSAGDFEMILVTENNEIYLTEGLEETFIPGELSQGIPIHIIKK